ncbi:MAG: DUF1679 domain-containing protein [Chloroflexi bacterium]|nr:DUF1679 domain-containing protein [Chloroflexota bacterium]
MTGNIGMPIAYGRTAEIYNWHDGQVLKLFHNWFELEDIEFEARIARAILASGLSVPAVGDVIQVNGRNGLAYQRVDGETMLKKMITKPWNVFSYAHLMAELHLKMHTSAIQADIPSQRKKLNSKIRRAETLPEHLRAKALVALDTMPDYNRLCHGDFHPGNILMSAQGEIVIDWIDASNGNPLADVARTTILALGAVETRQIQGFLPKALLRMFHAAYIHYYFKLSPGDEAEYNRWLPIAAAARLNENISELHEWLITNAERGL